MNIVLHTVLTHSYSPSQIDFMIQNIPPQQCMSFLWDESLQRLTLVSGVLGVRCRSPAARLTLLFCVFCDFVFLDFSNFFGVASIFCLQGKVTRVRKCYSRTSLKVVENRWDAKLDVELGCVCLFVCLFVCKPYIPTTLFWQKAPNLKLAKRAHGDSANSLVNWKNAKEMLCTWHVGWEQLLHGWQDVQASRLPRWLYFTSLRT